MAEWFKTLRVRNYSGWTILIFGVLALVMGLVGLVSPEAILQTLGFTVVPRTARAAGDYTIMFVIASSMAAFNMGVYYILAALTNTKRFFVWTVPFRVLTFLVFTSSALSGAAPFGMIGIGLWELIGALCTGGALYYERQRNIP